MYGTEIIRRDLKAKIWKLNVVDRAFQRIGKIWIAAKDFCRYSYFIKEREVYQFMEERRKINRVDYHANSVIVVCDT